MNGTYQDRVVRLSFDDYLVNSSQEFEPVWDVDSIMFTTSSLPILSDLYFYPFPNRFHTLTKNNKFTWCVNDHEVPIYQILNVHFGKTGQNGMFHVHLFFPKMRRKVGPKWVNFMSDKQYEDLYDKVVLPSIQNILPVDCIKEYPTSYSLMSKLCCSPNGQFQFATKVITKLYVRAVLAEMRRLIESNEELDSFKGFFFHTHAKNCKLVMRSSCGDPLKQLLQSYSDFEWELVDLRYLYLDIGLEVRTTSLSPTTLLWSKDFCLRYLDLLGLKSVHTHDWCATNTVGGANGSSKLPMEQILSCQLYMCEKNTLYTYDNGQPMSFSINDAVYKNTRYKRGVSLMLQGFTESRRKSFGI